jgi:hypothetical protein
MLKWTLVVVAAFATSLAVAQELEDEDSITAEKLESQMKENVGMSHIFRDTVAHIYGDLKQFEGYLKFDTEHVRCRIPIGEKDDWRLLDAWSRGEVDSVKGMKFKDQNLQLLWEIYHNEIQPQIISIDGKVVEPEESGGFGYMYIFDVSELARVKYTR